MPLWTFVVPALLTATGCCPASPWSSASCQDLETCRSVRSDGGCVLRVACTDDCTSSETVMTGTFSDATNASCIVDNHCHTQ